MSSDAVPGATPQQYVVRAELLADLGRYEDAAVELGYAVALDPADAAVRTLLARVRLAAGRPADALTAAEAALAVAPGLAAPLVLRGFALVDLAHYAEAAQVADELLRLGPEDAYAQRGAAAILAEARNGQGALNAAWRAVELAPEEAAGHLVLSLVAARMELFDLAERAYREALRLDPRLVSARDETGVVRLEQRRHARALEQVADGLAYLADAAPRGPVKGAGTVADELRRVVLYCAGYTMVVAVVLACVAGGNATAARIWAAVLALVGGGLLALFVARLPPTVRAALGSLARADRNLAVAGCATAAGPCLILLYAAAGTPWPLVLAIIAAAVAELAVFLRGG